MVFDEVAASYYASCNNSSAVPALVLHIGLNGFSIRHT